MAGTGGIRGAHQRRIPSGTACQEGRRSVPERDGNRSRAIGLACIRREETVVNQKQLRTTLAHPTPELPVEDVERAQQHYRDALGFEIGWLSGEIGVSRPGVLDPQALAELFLNVSSH